MLKLDFEDKVYDSPNKQLRVIKNFGEEFTKVISIQEAFNIIENSIPTYTFYRDGDSCLAHTKDYAIVFPYNRATHKYKFYAGYYEGDI